MHHAKSLCLISFILSVSCCWSQPVPLNSFYGKSYKMINGYTDYFAASSLISLDSVIRPEVQKKFRQQQKTGVIFLGYDPHYYWYRFMVRNEDSANRDLVLLLGGLGIRKAEIWKKKNASWNYAGITGYEFPFKERSYHYVHPAFSLNAEALSIDTFLIKVDESHSYKSVSFVLADPVTMQSYEHRFYFVMGILLGVLALFALFNLYLFFSIKEKIHLWYSLYILMMLFFVIKDEGLDPEFFGLDSSSGFRLTSMLGVASLALAFLLQMVQSFLTNINKTSVTGKIMTWLKIILFIMATIQFITFYIQPSNFIEKWVFHITKQIGLAVILVIIFACIYSFSHRFKPALFLLSGQLLFLTGGVFRNLFIGMDAYVFPPSVFEVGLIAEVMVISYGLMYRYNLYKKEKEQLIVELEQERLNRTKEILITQEDEQKRIAADLHDELGGNLAAIKMTLQTFPLSAEHAKTIHYLIDAASNTTRHIAHNLMPPEFDSTSLNILLDKFYQRLNTEGTIHFHFFSADAKNLLNKQEELIIYRIIMELTNNIIKHSKATEATIQIIYNDKEMSLMVEDNGQGGVHAGITGMGLKNIQSRVNFLNGNLHIDSSNAGTTILIQIPFNTVQ